MVDPWKDPFRERYKPLRQQRAGLQMDFEAPMNLEQPEKPDIAGFYDRLQSIRQQGEAATQAAGIVSEANRRRAQIAQQQSILGEIQNTQLPDINIDVPGWSAAGMGAGSTSAMAGGAWGNPLGGAGYRRTGSFGTARPGHRHAGLDLASPMGTPVYATQDGTIGFAGGSGSYGNRIDVTHSGSFSTRYAHLSRIAVRKGATVKRGQLIGYVGSTGRSTGAHLHFEVRIGGKAVNPLSYLRL